jgi:hypothetical protein
MSELTAAPEDAAPETYILSDEEHLRCLIAGAAQLGLVPAERLARVSRARFEQVANGAVLALWVRPAPVEPRAPRPKRKRNTQ